MSINYTIQAFVIDITQDMPRRTDKFLVDTNVWFWLTYSRASSGPTPPRNYQTTSYPRYIEKVKRGRIDLCYCPFSLAEMAHNIEKIEFEIFKSTDRAYDALKPKEFRHNFQSQRLQVTSEIEAAWGMIKTLALPLDITLDESETDLAVRELKINPMDGYDIFILNTMKKAGINQVITDDGDYATVKDIQVFTANRTVIQTARSQGKLLNR